MSRLTGPIVSFLLRRSGSKSRPAVGDNVLYQLQTEAAMDLSLFFGQTVVSAIIAGLVAFVTADRRARIDEKLAKLKGEIDHDIAARRATVDEKLAAMKAQFDRELAEQKVRLDNRAIFAAERVAHELLMHENWTLRSFSAIQGMLGGFEEDRLRQILVQAGAVRFRGNRGEELWGLIERNRDQLA
jgi:ribosome-associated translation inhibitor RaiA